MGALFVSTLSTIGAVVVPILSAMGAVFVPMLSAMGQICTYIVPTLSAMGAVVVPTLSTMGVSDSDAECYVCVSAETSSSFGDYGLQRQLFSHWPLPSLLHTFLSSAQRRPFIGDAQVLCYLL